MTEVECNDRKKEEEKKKQKRKKKNLQKPRNTMTKAKNMPEREMQMEQLNAG
ncbi:MAG: hypothetical protein ACTSQN_11880 [Candidatus Heimdallarchaeota archaeon]